MNTAPRFHLLLDQGISRDAAKALRSAGIECAHVGELDMSASSDTEILTYARSAGQVVVTLDADFHAVLAVSGMSSPSVIRIRIEGLKGPAMATTIGKVLATYPAELALGCMITVKERKTTCHLLGFYQ